MSDQVFTIRDQKEHLRDALRQWRAWAREQHHGAAPTDEQDAEVERFVDFACSWFHIELKDHPSR